MAYVEIGEIEHRSPTGAIDNITDGASHDKADAPAGEGSVGSSQPQEEADADGDRHGRQHPGRQAPSPPIRPKLTPRFHTITSRKKPSITGTMAPAFIR